MPQLGQCSPEMVRHKVSMRACREYLWIYRESWRWKTNGDSNHLTSAINLYNEAIGEDQDAMNLLATLYSGNEDVYKAHDLLKQVSNGENFDAAVKVAMCYLRGITGAEGPEIGMKRLNKAISDGNASQLLRI